MGNPADRKHSQIPGGKKEKRPIPQGAENPLGACVCVGRLNREWWQLCLGRRALVGVKDAC